MKPIGYITFGMLIGLLFILLALQAIKLVWTHLEKTETPPPIVLPEKSMTVFGEDCKYLRIYASMNTMVTVVIGGETNIVKWVNPAP